ncbi:hypothetical protein [Algicola sagamiensis]|uniref:hypothetical protein n=1 Tax=Algicola sagamiensis TaxID=163869 RepID=UPI00037AD1DD|nr:hypothetical protein [Algicola sagamiensis]
MNKRSFVEDVEPLPKEQKIRFYTKLSNELSVIIRSLSLKECGLPEFEDPLQAIHVYSEVIHRCLNRVSDLKSSEHDFLWTEACVWKLIKNAVRQYPTHEVKAYLSWSIDSSLKGAVP